MFTQDDAHIYCLPGQVEDEVLAVIELVRRMYKTFGFDGACGAVHRPEKSIAQMSCGRRGKGPGRGARALRVPYTLNPGDGPFTVPRSTSTSRT